MSPRFDGTGNAGCRLDVKMLPKVAPYVPRERARYLRRRAAVRLAAALFVTVLSAAGVIALAWGCVWVAVEYPAAVPYAAAVLTAGPVLVWAAVRWLR